MTPSGSAFASAANEQALTGSAAVELVTSATDAQLAKDTEFKLQFCHAIMAATSTSPTAGTSCAVTGVSSSRLRSLKGTRQLSVRSVDVAYYLALKTDAATVPAAVADGAFAGLLKTQLQSRVSNIAAVSSIDDVSSATPDAALRKTLSYNWVIKSDGSEHDLIVCGKGDAIRLYWESGTHDLVHMGNEANYVACDFRSTQGSVTL